MQRPARQPVLLLLTICLAAGCASTSQRSPAERQVDAELAAQVEAACSADPKLFARHIDVAVERGTVWLGG